VSTKNFLAPTILLPNATKRSGFDTHFLLGTIQDMNDSEILDPITVKQAAKLLGLTIQRVRQLLWDKRLIGRKVKGRAAPWEVSRASVIAYRDSANGPKLAFAATKPKSKLVDPVCMREAARILGITRQRVSVLLHTRELKGRKVDGIWFVERESCENRKRER
jgi:plasmid maintenance system antidote protein VapI